MEIESEKQNEILKKLLETGRIRYDHSCRNLLDGGLVAFSAIPGLEDWIELTAHGFNLAQRLVKSSNNM
jgi:hypothetical protein